MRISSELTALLRNRRAELWVCQRYDLLPGENTHDYGTPIAEVGLRYRLQPDGTDQSFARLYWNAVWLEGANSPILRALREEEQSAHPLRRLVVLASEADANADVSSQSFLPAFVLPGLIDSSATDAQYGAMGRRARESLAWTFARKIVEFPGSVLVVLGAQSASDLELLWETLLDSPVRDLTVLVAWSDSTETLPKPTGALVDIQIFPGTSAELVSALVEAGAPDSNSVSSVTVRVGKASVILESQDTQFITKRMALIFESSFAATGALGPENLEAFFDLSLDDWSCYSAGVLPVPRSYRTDLGVSLNEDVLMTLRQVAGGAKGQRTFVFQLPAESASGVTTLLRSVAYSAAEAGFPTLVARTEQVELDIEDLVAFVTSLNDAAKSSGILDLPPILLVIDVDHSERNRIFARQAAQSLATQGRKAVILQALRAEGGDEGSPSRNERWAVLPVLHPAVTTEEVTECARRFTSLANDWSLGSGVQDEEDWRRYHTSTTITGPSGEVGSEALFWVAIRFYVCEGAGFLQQESLRESLSNWIVRRTADIKSEDSRKLVNYVAALSSFRLVSPLMTVLRPITSSVFSSSVVDTLRQLRDIVVWKDYSSDLDDQILTFRHPVIADEYLRSIGVNTEAKKIELVRPILMELSPGGKADLWLVEMLATTVLAPEYRGRVNDWEWRLKAFEWIPPAIAERSKAILHHWARCLSQSIGDHMLLSEEKRKRLAVAIDKLEQALTLERRPGRDEHPGHMLNTLGVVYNDLAVFLETQGDTLEATKAWDKSCSAFERSIALMSGENVISYLAFSNRLLRHARVWPNASPVTSDDALREIARAIALLDEAEEAITGMAAPDPSWFSILSRYKICALNSLGGERAAEHIELLKESVDPSLGYYCEARLRLGEGTAPVDIDAAAAILTGAMDTSIDLGPDALRLLVQLMRKSDKYRKDFETQSHIYRKLERVGGTRLSLVDMFRIAVLCYQTGEFMEGSERFRKIREIARQAQSTHAPQRVTDYWQDSQGKQRLAQVRVDKAVSDWRGEGYVDAIGQTVPLRPRHFTPLARIGEIRECMIRFEVWGPLAVPVRLDRT